MSANNLLYGKAECDRIWERRHVLGIKRNKGDAKASMLFDIAKVLKCRMAAFF